MGPTCFAGPRGSWATCLTSSHLFPLALPHPECQPWDHASLTLPALSPTRSTTGLHLGRPPSCLGHPLPLSLIPYPLSASSLALVTWIYELYPCISKCMQWLSLDSGIMCGFYFLLDIFCSTMYLPNNHLYKWKKNCCCLKRIVVILCPSLPVSYGIIKARTRYLQSLKPIITCSLYIR